MISASRGSGSIRNSSFTLLELNLRRWMDLWSGGFRLLFNLVVIYKQQQPERDFSYFKIYKKSHLQILHYQLYPSTVDYPTLHQNTTQIHGPCDKAFIQSQSHSFPPGDLSTVSLRASSYRCRHFKWLICIMVVVQLLIDGHYAASCLCCPLFCLFR